MARFPKPYETNILMFRSLGIAQLHSVFHYPNYIDFFLTAISDHDYRPTVLRSLLSFPVPIFL